MGMIWGPYLLVNHDCYLIDMVSQLDIVRRDEFVRVLDQTLYLGILIF